MQIRVATEEDVPVITSIYNATIHAGPSTAQLDPVSLADRLVWFKAPDRTKFPVWILGEHQDSLGFLSLNPYRPGRRALDGCAEISYFIRPGHQGLGFASRLMEEALAQAPGLGFCVLLAILLETNTASIQLLEKFRFQRWGHLPRIAEIQGRRVGQFYYGVNLEQSSRDSDQRP